MVNRKSYAKVNIFLKIVGKRGNYHEIISRFVKVKSLFDVIEFVPSSEKSFTLEGDFSCSTESNIIYKSYKALLNHTKSNKLQEYFTNLKVVVTKSIAESAGLGGGCSNGATFMLMCNDELSLGIDIDTLALIGAKIGADLPFFIYDYDSANVSGIGEIVKEYKDDMLKLEIITPQIECNTAMIYSIFRDRFYQNIDKKKALKLQNLSSKEILNNYKIESLNDLYQSALFIEPKLSQYAKDKWFFSGSGSSFFKKI